MGAGRHRPGLDASHFLVEDLPEEIADELKTFVTTRPTRRPDHVQRRHHERAAARRPRRQAERTELQHVASSIPGRDIVQVLTEIPAGVESGWHQHPGEEVGYIVAGTVRMEIEDRPTLTLNAGDPFLIPPRTPHNALDLGPDTGRMLSTYLVETGEPIATFTRS